MIIQDTSKHIDKILRHYDWYYMTGIAENINTIYIYTKKRMPKQFSLNELTEIEKLYKIRFMYMGKVIPG